MSNTTIQHPSNARVRRQNHLERQAAVRARKRLRQQRAEIHRAMEQAVAMTSLAGPADAQLEVKPYRALDRREDGGWRYEDALGRAYYAASRDKARAEAKRLNDAPPITRDAVMRQCGFERVMLDRKDGGDTIRDGSTGWETKALPIEQKFTKMVEA